LEVSTVTLLLRPGQVADRPVTDVHRIRMLSAVVRSTPAARVLARGCLSHLDDLLTVFPASARPVAGEPIDLVLVFLRGAEAGRSSRVVPDASLGPVLAVLDSATAEGVRHVMEAGATGCLVLDWYPIDEQRHVTRLAAIATAQGLSVLSPPTMARTESTFRPLHADPSCPTGSPAGWDRPSPARPDGSRPGSDRPHGAPSGHPQADELTSRERDVLDLLSGGLTTREIAGRLGLAPKTVRNMLSQVYAKLGVRHQGEALLWWLAKRSAGTSPAAAPRAG
jgi:DNA-binding NarL/FixJ family response regulator